MIFNNLLFVSFPGKDEIKLQLENSKYEIIDHNGSLKIYPLLQVSAPVEKTIPLEAWAYDIDGVLIHVLSMF